MTTESEQLECFRTSNDAEILSTVMARAAEATEVVLEATYGWTGRSRRSKTWAGR